MNLNYYQICTYKDKADKYAVRKFIINQKNEIISQQIMKASKDQAEKLMNNLKLYQYKCFPAYDFKHISYPNVNDVLQLKSPILSNDVDYTGFAKF